MWLAMPAGAATSRSGRDPAGTVPTSPPMVLVVVALAKLRKYEMGASRLAILFSLSVANIALPFAGFVVPLNLVHRRPLLGCRHQTKLA